MNAGTSDRRWPGNRHPFLLQLLDPERDKKDLAYRGLAAAVHRLTRAGKQCPEWLARAMFALAPSGGLRQVALDLRQALASGTAEQVLSIAFTARRAPDRRAEKIVSHRYRFVWICNPKVASRSIIAALCQADPEARLIRDLTSAQLYAAEPRIREYLSFAFVRNPYTRSHSFYADRVVRASTNRHRPMRHFHGTSEDTSFDDLCTWLNTPYGSDAFADRHWLSQHVQTRLPSGRLPDVLGRYECIEEDLGAIAARLDMPASALPVVNTMTGWHPVEAMADQHLRRRARDLSTRNRRLLRARYAEDFDLLGYAP